MRVEGWGGEGWMEEDRGGSVCVWGGRRGVAPGEGRGWWVVPHSVPTSPHQALIVI